MDDSQERCTVGADVQAFITEMTELASDPDIPVEQGYIAARAVMRAGYLTAGCVLLECNNGILRKGEVDPGYARCSVAQEVQYATTDTRQRLQAAQVATPAPELLPDACPFAVRALAAIVECGRRARELATEPGLAAVSDRIEYLSQANELHNLVMRCGSCTLGTLKSPYSDQPCPQRFAIVEHLT